MTRGSLEKGGACHTCSGVVMVENAPQYLKVRFYGCPYLPSGEALWRLWFNAWPISPNIKFLLRWLITARCFLISKKPQIACASYTDGACNWVWWPNRVKQCVELKVVRTDETSQWNTPPQQLDTWNRLNVSQSCVGCLRNCPWFANWIKKNETEFFLGFVQRKLVDWFSFKSIRLAQIALIIVPFIFVPLFLCSVQVRWFGLKSDGSN